MGDATYCLLAEFSSEEEAEFAEKIARLVLEQLASFNEEWQKIRHETGKSVIKRHKYLLRKYPLVRNFIRLPKPVSDDSFMNYLAGECEMNRDFELYRDERYIKLSCCVWHLASWDNIAEFFYRIGAIRVTWESDESIDPWMLLELRLEKEPIRTVERIPREELEVIAIATVLGK